MNEPASPPRRSVVTTAEGTRTEYFDVVPSEAVLRGLLTELFELHWNQLVFGPCLQGAVFELELASRPHVGYLDGYLTVGSEEARAGHFHLCVGPHHGTETAPTPPELAAWRRCARAAFYRDFDRSGRSRTWGFRMWNGRGEQMLTIFFPNPWLDPARRGVVDRPDWTRLSLWMQLRETYAGVSRDPPPIETTAPELH